jgi:hypothetical protein
LDSEVTVEDNLFMVNPEWSFVKKSWADADLQYLGGRAGHKTRAQGRRSNCARTKNLTHTLKKPIGNTKGAVKLRRPSYSHLPKRFDGIASSCDGISLSRPHATALRHSKDAS